MMLRRILLVLALAAPGLAGGQALDPPGRIARLAHVEGEVTFQPAEGRPTGRLPRRPLEPGDRITTDRSSRAELALGTATIRLDERSELAIRDLDTTAVRIDLADGSASVYLNELPEGDAFEIVAPNTVITLEGPGDYRADVLAGDSTALTVHVGAASVETAAGPVRIAAGQRVRLDGREAIARLERPLAEDDFDDWVLERELRLAENEPPRYTPYEGGYGELDRYGEWYDEPRYGRVWMPGYGYSGWSPYHDGYWQRSDFGWSWFDPAPWGYYSYYGGRWMYLPDRHRWCWVPTRQEPRQRPHDDELPYWYPRARPTPESAPRTADAAPNAGGVPEPVTIAPSTPRRVDLDRRPTRAREMPSGEPPRGGTIARGGPREPRPAAPAATPPRETGTTMRPTSPPPARERPAPESSSRISRETGSRQEP